MRRSRWIFALLMAVLVACGGEDGGAMTGGGEEGAMAQLKGSVFYRERMALPPGAEVEVQLQDVSRADAPAATVASVVLTPDHGPPYEFSIDYDPGQIDSRHRYALRAKISAEGRLLFTSTEYVDPFGGTALEVLVQRVPEPVERGHTALEGSRWELQTLGGEPAGTGARGRPVDLEFLAGKQGAGGFSGCNRYSGGYSLEGSAPHGSALKFGPMAGTRMACVEGGDLEHAYLQMLGRVDAFRLQGETLSLLSGGEVVATFRAL
jgi:putative lipoprotein